MDGLGIMTAIVIIGCTIVIGLLEWMRSNGYQNPFIIMTSAFRIGNSWRTHHRRTADTEQTRSCGEAMDETSGKIYNEQLQILAMQACRSLCHRTVA